MENSSNFNLKKNIIIAVVVMLCLLGLDIASKLVIHYTFNANNIKSIEVIPNFFWLYLTYNTGAAWSFLADVSWGRYLLAVVSFIGSALSIFYLVKHFKNMHILLRIALYLFIPGCTGNFIDRANLYNTPGVIDFLSFKLFGSYYFPVFNLADSFLVISIIIFAIYAFFFDKDDDDKKTKKDDVEKAIASFEEEKHE